MNGLIAPLLSGMIVFSLVAVLIAWVFFSLYRPVETWRTVMRFSIASSRASGSRGASFSKFDEAMRLYETDRDAFAQAFASDIARMKFSGIVALGFLVFLVYGVYFV